jgi:hypothetical protein
MGYLTPMLFRNDDIHMLKEDPEALDKIYSACQTPRPTDISLQGNFRRKPWWAFWKKKEWGCSCGGAVESLGTRHADENRVIVVYGNTWSDISFEYVNRKFNKFDPTVRMDKIMLDYLETCANIALDDAMALKKYITDYRKEHKNENVK